MDEENIVIAEDVEEVEAEGTPTAVLLDGETKYDYIQRRRADGLNMRAIAAELGISYPSAYRIVRVAEERATKWDSYKAPSPPPPPKKRGRPKGSKNKNQSDWYSKRLNLVDPETGIVVQNRGQQAIAIGRMGDERVTAFVAYHMECLKMREGVDKKDVPDLYQRFYRYLAYCAEHGIIPNNMNAYLAIGISRQDVSAWRLGKLGTPEHQQFAQDVADFFASVHEQAPTDGLMNPISAMFWQKAHDGMIEASKVEVVQYDPLGEKRSAAEIAERYADILPEDN